MAPDIMLPSQRHRVMAHNRGRTKPERALASGLWRKGLRFLTHKGYTSLTGKRLVGKPDIIFPRKRIAIFVDGCFWHGCPRCKGIPQQSGEFWKNKITANIARDGQVTHLLEEQGWTVIRVPEHGLRTKPALMRTVDSLVASILRSTVDPI